MLYHLKNGPMRSSELQKKLRNISNKMFTQTARALQHDGLISRQVFHVVPPRVEYTLTPMGESVIPLLCKWVIGVSQSGPTPTNETPLLYYHSYPFRLTRLILSHSTY